MKPRTKLLLTTGVVLILVCCSAAARTAFKVVAWARVLPNRIVIDGDGLGGSLADAVVQSYHEALVNGDSATQSQVIRDFTNLVAHDDTAREWVRTEYSCDLTFLASSPDVDVAALATELLEELAASSNDGSGESTEQKGGFGSRSCASEAVSLYSPLEPK